MWLCDRFRRFRRLWWRAPEYRCLGVRDLEALDDGGQVLVVLSVVGVREVSLDEVLAVGEGEDVAAGGLLLLDGEVERVRVRALEREVGALHDPGRRAVPRLHGGRVVVHGVAGVRATAGEEVLDGISDCFGGRAGDAPR